MMPNTLPRDSVSLSLTFVFLLLPFAQIKVLFWGVPLYLPEIAICIASLFFLRRFFGKTLVFPDKFSIDSGILSGVLLFFSGALLSLLINPFSLTGLGMLKSWFLFPILVATLVFFEAKDEEKRTWFLVVWFLTLVATALGSLTFVALGSMSFDNRLFGLFSSPNFLAVFLAPGIFLALHLLPLIKRVGQQRALPLKIAVIGGALSLVATIYFTRSYSVWIALLVSLSVFFFFQKKGLPLEKKTTFIALGTLLFITSTFFFFDADTDKWRSLVSFGERSSLASRGMIWRSAERIIEENWLFGIGVGRFQEVYLEYQRFFPPYLEWAVPEPHNIYMATLLSTGSIGIAGLALLIARLFFLEINFFRRSEKKDQRSLALITVSFMIFFLVYGLADTPYFKNDLALSFWLFLSLGLSLLGSTYQEKDYSSIR